MRLGVTGKGGSGKTTIAAALARLYARRGYHVNALDGDPNPNLAVALGLSHPEVAGLRRVPREAVLEERVNGDGTRSLDLARPFEDVLARYGATAPDDVRVLNMTGLLGAGKGCICGQHAAVRDVMAELGTQRPTEVTILDTEASIEHLSRGTVRNVDALLVVAEPYYRSLETAGRIVPLAKELGIDHIWMTGNKVRDARDEAAIGEYAARHGFELLGTVPFDDLALEAERLGVALVDHTPTAPAIVAVNELADRLADRLAPIFARTHG